MAISWGPTDPQDSTTLSTIGTPVRVNYRDKAKGRQASLGPVRHCVGKKISTAKTILNRLEPYSAMLISSIESVHAYNTAGFDDANVPVDPGADNPAATFVFVTRPDGGGQPYTDKLYLPAAKDLDSNGKEALGQLIADDVQANLPANWTCTFVA